MSGGPTTAASLADGASTPWCWRSGFAWASRACCVEPTSTGARLLFWASSVELVRRHPWFGTGLGSWQSRITGAMSATEREKVLLGASLLAYHAGSLANAFLWDSVEGQPFTALAALAVAGSAARIGHDSDMSR